MGVSICGRRSGYYEEPYSGVFECGYGTMSGCYFEDANTGGSGYQCIELGGTAYYTIDSCVVGRNRTGTVTGTHLAAMLEMNADATSSHKYNAGYTCDQHNTITNNIFDGSGSAGSYFNARGGYLTFTGNTVIQRTCQGFKNGHHGTVNDNEFRAVDAAGALSTSIRAMWVADWSTMTLTGNTFKSKADNTVLVSTDYDAPTGYSYGIAFDTNEFVKDAGDTRVAKDAGSDFTNINYTDTAA
jgi:hypothetical protein